MRSYECVFNKEGKTPHMWACWNPLYSSGSYPKDCVIWIDQFTCKETEKYIELIVKVINKIQPCELIHEGKSTYIAYKLIGKYNNDILLLNFIRNLWYSHHTDYSIHFFEELEKLDKKRLNRLSPMEMLTTANKYAVQKCGKDGSGHHSNCHELVQVKKLPEDFYTKQICETKDFLCKL